MAKNTHAFQGEGGGGSGGAPFQLVSISGDLTGYTTLQGAIDAATGGGHITMYKNAHEPAVATVDGSGNPVPARGANVPLITHKYGVSINTNGYNIPRITDSDNSGKFVINGGGKISQCLFTFPNTDATIDCYFDWNAATTNIGDGSIDSTFSCKRVYLEREVVITQNTWLVVDKAINFTINNGYLVGYKGYATQDVAQIVINATFTGNIILRGTFIGNNYRHLLGNNSGSAGNVYLENVSLFNNLADGDPSWSTGGSASHGVLYVAANSTTNFYFSGTNVMKGRGWSVIQSDRPNLVLNIDGELTYQGPINGIHAATVTFVRTTTKRVGETTGGGGLSKVDFIFPDVSIDSVDEIYLDAKITIKSTTKSNNIASVTYYAKEEGGDYATAGVLVDFAAVNTWIAGNFMAGDRYWIKAVQVRTVGAVDKGYHTLTL